MSSKEWFAAVGLLLAASSSSAPPASAQQPPAPTIPAVDRAVEAEMIQQDLVGVAVGVVRNGSIVHLNAYGFADLERKIPATVETPFRWASVSKPLTAVAAFQMIDSPGIDLELDDPVGSLPVAARIGWPTAGFKAQVTIARLLSHRSGVQQYGRGVADEEGQYEYDRDLYRSDDDGFNAERAVAVFRDADLDFNFAKSHLYSTFGYVLLGAVLDQLSPNGYVAWVQDRIAGVPAGRRSLQVSTSDSWKGYSKGCNGVRVARNLGSREWVLPGGGWQSDIEDLTQFARDLMSGALVPDAARLWPTIADNERYGRGFQRVRNGAGELRVWHKGDHANASAILYLYPELDLGIAILTNDGYVDQLRLSHHVADALGRSHGDVTGPIAYWDEEDESCEESPERFAGIWRQTGGEVLIRRGYTREAWGEEFARLRAAGYVCDDFETYVEDGARLWDGIFRERPGRNAMFTRLSFDAFDDKFHELALEDLRLVDLETYIDETGRRRWAGLFRPGSDRHALHRDLTLKELQQKQIELERLGVRLIDVEVHFDNGQPRWSGVWAAGRDTRFFAGRSFDQFNRLWREQDSEGFRLVDIETYELAGQRRWAGLWQKGPARQALLRERRFGELIEKHAGEYTPEGFELIDLERYIEE